MLHKLPALRSLELKSVKLETGSGSGSAKSPLLGTFSLDSLEFSSCSYGLRMEPDERGALKPQCGLMGTLNLFQSIGKLIIQDMDGPTVSSVHLEPFREGWRHMLSDRLRVRTFPCRFRRDTHKQNISPLDLLSDMHAESLHIDKATGDLSRFMSWPQTARDRFLTASKAQSGKYYANPLLNMHSLIVLNP